MDKEAIKRHLVEHGWCIIPDVLSRDEIGEAKQLFYDWQKTIPNHDIMHNTVDPHGIYKFHEAGHQEHAWFIRTRPNVQQVFRDVWDTDELVVSFDGSCYLSQELSKKDNIWTHSDQSAQMNKLCCYQGFVSLTDNQERTLVVYDKTHLIHHEYFKAKGQMSKGNWQRVDKADIIASEPIKRALHVPAGALVLWDSRTFHQNQYGAPKSEERIVQYVCFMPKNNKKNTAAMQKKRRKYFDERRTTSHWPYPIQVNGLQPQTYGDSSKLIDYDSLQKSNLERFLPDIEKII